MGELMDNLHKAMNEIEKHRDIIDNFHNIFFRYFNVTSEFSKENIKKLIMIDIQSTAGPNKNSKKLNKIINKVDAKFDGLKEIFDTKSNEEFVESMWKKLTEIKIPEKFIRKNKEYERKVGIGPKVAALILKNMFDKNLINKKIEKEHLYLPIDIWVKRMLLLNLNCSELIKNSDKISEAKIKSYYNKKSKDRKETDNKLNKILPMPSDIDKLKEVQDKLSKIYSPRIELDYLWFIGYAFCSKRSKFTCNKCWINKYCNCKA